MERREGKWEPLAAPQFHLKGVSSEWSGEQKLFTGGGWQEADSTAPFPEEVHLLQGDTG